MTEIKLYVININGEAHEISEEVYNRLEDLEKQVEGFRQMLKKPDATYFVIDGIIKGYYKKSIDDILKIKK